jgi:hypothetical protein
MKDRETRLSNPKFFNPAGVWSRNRWKLKE